MRLAITTLSVALLAALGCGSADEKTTLSEAAQRGKLVYQNVCIACHNADPNKDGSVGPANAGASRELVEAKVIRAEYPAGYTPKRTGGVMPKFPYLAEQIADLTAYLNEVAK
jgi:mono/diheme cytochrome c family protein